MKRSLAKDRSSNPKEQQQQHKTAAIHRKVIHNKTMPSRTITFTWAAFYVLSGICQPLLMTVAKQAGLADPTAQLYMFFYYLGPSVLLLTILRENCTASRREKEQTSDRPSCSILIKATLIAVFDIIAQGMNYTGASMAGPTVFAIIYSSVTIWTAVFSRMFLSRSLTAWQWVAVISVFLGLAVTATDSIRLGPNVARGTVLVVVGSILHGSTYVMSEAIMTVTSEQLSVRQNVAIQGSVACVALGVWQLVYTAPRFEELVGQPARQAGTHLDNAIIILLAFAIANLVHSVTFSHTLKYYPGGATSAGVMKGLQAVLVFVAAHLLYCGHVGGSEMCFTFIKFVSLITVSGGVIAFGILTERWTGYTPVIGEDIALEAKV